MKILLFGCVTMIVLSVVVFAAGGYLAEKFFGNIIASEDSSFGKRAEKLRISNRFTPRADGYITEDQLLRLLKVSEKTSALLQDENMKREMEDLQKSKNPYVDGFRFWAKFGNRWRNAFLDALTDQNMSLDEYQYVHKNALRSWAAVMKEMGEKAFQENSSQSGDQQPLPKVPDDLYKFLEEATNVPPQNLDVIRKHQTQVDKYLPAAPLAKLLFPLLVDPDKDSVF